MDYALGMPYQGLSICDDLLTYEKMVHRLSYTSMKTVQDDIQKSITWQKKV